MSERIRVRPDDVVTLHDDDEAGAMLRVVRAHSPVNVAGSHADGVRLVYVGPQVPPRVLEELRFRYVRTQRLGAVREHNAQILGAE